MPRKMARTPKTEIDTNAAQEPRSALPKETESTAAKTTENEPGSAPARTKKIDQVVALLGREDGATLAEMVAATGWLPHTTRAALTGLRKKGHVLDKAKRDGVTCYRIVAAG